MNKKGNKEKKGEIKEKGRKQRRKESKGESKLKVNKSKE